MPRSRPWNGCYHDATGSLNSEAATDARLASFQTRGREHSGPSRRAKGGFRRRGRGGTTGSACTERRFSTRPPRRFTAFCRTGRTPALACSGRPARVAFSRCGPPGRAMSACGRGTPMAGATRGPRPRSRRSARGVPCRLQCGPAHSVRPVRPDLVEGRGCELTVTAIRPVEAVLLIWADIAGLRRDFGDVQGQLAEPPERPEQPRPPRMIQ